MSSVNFPPRIPPQLDSSIALAVLLMAAADAPIRRGLRMVAEARRPRYGSTLKPGPRTPLWNELVSAVRAQFTRRGDRAQLGRILGLPRQRINDLFNTRRHLLDAERTLLLLAWLQARSVGEDFG